MICGRYKDFKTKAEHYSYYDKKKYKEGLRIPPYIDFYSAGDFQKILLNFPKISEAPDELLRLILSQNDLPAKIYLGDEHQAKIIITQYILAEYYQGYDVIRTLTSLNSQEPRKRKHLPPSNFIFPSEERFPNYEAAAFVGYFVINLDNNYSPQLTDAKIEQDEMWIVDVILYEIFWEYSRLSEYKNWSCETYPASSVQSIEFILPNDED